MMPSNGALIVRYCCSCLTACTCACAALIESSYDRTSACAETLAADKKMNHKAHKEHKEHHEYKGPPIHRSIFFVAFVFLVVRMFALLLLNRSPWFIEFARGIVRVQRGRECRHARLQEGINGRQHDQRGQGGEDEPADYGATKRCALCTIAGAERHRDHAGNHRRGS